MRGPKGKPLTLAAAFVFLLNSVTCQLIEAKPTDSLVEQSSKSDFLLLDPAEEFINDVLEDFRSRLSDGSLHLKEHLKTCRNNCHRCLEITYLIMQLTYLGFPEYGLPCLDPLQVPKLAFNLRFAKYLKHLKTSKLSCSSEMFEVSFTSSSSLNLTNLSNFTTNIVHLDLDASEMEIKMNVSKMRVINPFFVLISDHWPG